MEIILKFLLLKDIQHIVDLRDDDEPEPRMEPHTSLFLYNKVTIKTRNEIILFLENISLSERGTVFLVA